MLNILFKFISYYTKTNKFSECIYNIAIRIIHKYPYGVIFQTFRFTSVLSCNTLISVQKYPRYISEICPEKVRGHRAVGLASVKPQLCVLVALYGVDQRRRAWTRHSFMP